MRNQPICGKCGARKSYCICKPFRRWRTSLAPQVHAALHCALERRWFGFVRTERSVYADHAQGHALDAAIL